MSKMYGKRPEECAKVGGDTLCPDFRCVNSCREQSTQTEPEVNPNDELVEKFKIMKRNNNKENFNNCKRFRSKKKIIPYAERLENYNKIRKNIFGVDSIDNRKIYRYRKIEKIKKVREKFKFRKIFR